MSLAVDVALDAQAALGEGPWWDASTATLLWVDIVAGRVHRFDPARGTDVAHDLGRLVSLAIARASGGIVVGVPDGLAALDDEGRLAPLVDPEPGEPANRPNDGLCDARGRLWLGTMALDETSPAAGLYRVDGDLTVTRLLGGTTISNGLGWSPSGDRFYFIDSPTRRVDVFDCEPTTGVIENRRTLAAVEVPGAVPDGMKVDAEGCLWVVLHGGGQVHRYDPRGELLEVVPLLVTRPTSCCFGGPGLRDLYVTTRRDGLSANDLAEQPLAGALLRLDPGVCGRPLAPFSG